MTLLHAGLALAGLCAVAIPIIIHLLARQRRKPIEWAAMRFLIEAFRKQRRRLQLEQLILLAVRCLIIGLLGLALGRPLLESAGLLDAGAARSVYFVIDDGLASGLAPVGERTALEKHVAEAVKAIEALGPGDAVGVVTASRPAKPLLIPPSTDHTAVINLLQALKPSEAPTDIAGAFEFVRSAVRDSTENQRQTLVYLLSDFRGGSAAIDSPLPQTLVQKSGNIRLIATPPAALPVSNVQVVSIEPVRSMVLPNADDGSGQITVRLRRSGDLQAEVTRVRLSGDGLGAIEPKTVRWGPGESEADVEFIAQYESGAKGETALTATIDNDPLAADNQRHSIIELREQVRVLVIDRRSFGFERALDHMSAGQWIRRALEPQESSPLQVVEAEPAALDLADLRATDVAILPRPDLLNDAGWSALRGFINGGGLLIITPPAEVNVHTWTQRLTDDLGLRWQMDLEVAEHEGGLALAAEQPPAEVLRMISSDLADLVRPVLAFRTLRVSEAETAADRVLVFADGAPMLIAGSPLTAEANAEGAAPENNEDAPAPPAASGVVMLMTVAPELTWTNLPSKPLMLPLFHELVRQGLSLIRASQHMTVGEQPALARGPAARKLLAPDGRTIALDEAGRPREGLAISGIYSILDRADEPIGTVAVNVDAGAGDSTTQSAAAVGAWLAASGPWTVLEDANLAGALGAGELGSPISGLLLLIVVALVLLETVLARWFSHAYSDERAGVAGSISSRAAGALKAQTASAAEAAV